VTVRTHPPVAEAQKTSGGPRMIFDSVASLREVVGMTIGPTAWTVIDQELVNSFMAATGDHRWIRLDAEQAALEAFDGTIAHGYLSLSLLPSLVSQLLEIRVSSRVNYGLNRVRFPAPAPTGSRVRASVEILSVMDGANGSLMAARCEIEIEGRLRPACVAVTPTLLAD
jgi:acyl dehydratase